MWITTIITAYLFSQTCLGLDIVDLPDTDSDSELSPNDLIGRRNLEPARVQTTVTQHWLFRQSDTSLKGYDDEKDSNIKNKITVLVQQTLHDTENKIKSIQHLKETHRQEPPYRVGFVLSMVKKARDILNELFNVAVKHRDEWKALEQLKIFELIVHTNVDTTNLVRQLVEIHISYLNATSAESNKRRVVLL